jgi:hypothetical protein
MGDPEYNSSVRHPYFFPHPSCMTYRLSVGCVLQQQKENFGNCGNMYPYTVTDDRVGRNKKRKDNGKDFFRRDCMRKFSYHETFLCHLCSEDILE